MLGLNEAVLLGELCSEYSYWNNIDKLEDDGYFYSTRENIEENTRIIFTSSKNGIKDIRKQRNNMHEAKRNTM